MKYMYVRIHLKGEQKKCKQAAKRPGQMDKSNAKAISSQDIDWSAFESDGGDKNYVDLSREIKTAS